MATKQHSKTVVVIAPALGTAIRVKTTVERSPGKVTTTQETDRVTIAANR